MTTEEKFDYLAKVITKLEVRLAEIEKVVAIEQIVKDISDKAFGVKND